MANTNDANGSSPGSFVTPEPLAPLVNGLKRAFDSSDHTDLTIICQGRQWKVHKVLLCAQSEWFETSCAGCWKEGQEGTITFKDDHPQVIEAMLRWFYEHDYGTSQDTKWPLVFDIQVYAVADKYLLPNLKHLAATNFEQRAEKNWKSKDFETAVTDTYEYLLDSDGTLMQTMARIVSKHRKDLFHPVTGSLELKALAVRIPEFGSDVLRASIDAEGGSYCAKYRCPRCRKRFRIKTGTYSFVCPNGCIGARTMKFWAQHKAT
ncbi:hypothetical protein KC343_g4719 [Hortaea werneckii]|uniref:BTB domain-containing protein n=1 Tax=Hortaea werneckii TaxID=91943 RepID=A0A3M7FF19_HORWE|nr:hypothetical protein KC352_g3605 [Hortaea werneckii]KAI7343852.1 hypothetical protein KC320_g9102 [Hortaea werneckii]KAI7568881.1 hypothetical protein KC317_g3795 [Hortaea werneckii]KAI7623209.1 hypothetical protein KC346_g2842 [Hortaea werneckii]KAI7630287.1 hypothetical protein KC343_g4719 [Hortaea werneckii]